MNKPNILHPRLCQLIDGKYPELTRSDGQKKNKVVFVGVMRSSYRMLQLCLCLICIKVFLDETIFKIG